MKHKHSSTWNVARKLKNEKDETQTLYDMEYGEKNEKSGKLNTNTLPHGMWQEN